MEMEVPKPTVNILEAPELGTPHYKLLVPIAWYMVFAI